MQNMVKLIHQLSSRHNTAKVYSDFVEMSAIAISNTVDKNQYYEREKRYLDIVKQYKKEEIDEFPKLLAMLTNHLEEEPKDILGDVFHELELHNEHKGQFFTPFPICKMMAKMIIGDNYQTILSEKGFITISEPACGTGAMVVAAAQEFRTQGINYQQNLHVTAVDLDSTCVHAAYVQFSLLHIPATLIHGNTLTLEEFSHWFTPAHVWGAWGQKLERSQRLRQLKEVITNISAKDTAATIAPNNGIIPPSPLNKFGTQLNIF